VASTEPLTLGEQFLPSGDEAGGAPGGRRFRPDVQGLRAVAVLLVVLYHANVPGITGGYVGVDVFFVISGFVIMGVLLRERAATGRTSILAFYGRRCRRIIPAATLVIVITVLLTYHFLGFISGDNAAVDGRWAAVFLSNFHFEAVGTNYLAALAPPSPLQNYWSLSVEEQFYAVFPMLVLLVARLRGRLSFEARLAITLGMIIVGSFSLSVIQTSTNSAAAYFSPLTRAWELALGAMIAVGTGWLHKMPERAAAVISWIGLGAIIASAFVFNAQSEYPGWLVALPVVGAGLIITGGSAAPRLGAESLLSLAPFSWLGQLSYSLYLWHWPILVLAAESQGQTTLPASQSMWWVALSLVAAIGTFLLVENPIRHAKLFRRSRWASIVLGAGLTVFTLIVLTVQIADHGGSGATTEAPATSAGSSSPASAEVVRRLVTAAVKIHRVPADITPSVGSAYFDYGIPDTWPGCSAAYSQTQAPSCTFGDPQGTHTLVLYGDSHAVMWARAVNDIAIRARWKFVLLAKGGCPIASLPYLVPTDASAGGGEWAACDQWHKNEIARINRIDPELLLVTEATHDSPSGALYTPAEWQRGLEHTLNLVTSPNTMKVVLGNIPYLPQPGPTCLARHPDDVQACSGPSDLSRTSYDQAEKRAAAATGTRYIDVASWFCSTACTPIIGHYEVYVDGFHITNTYARFLEGVLAQALNMPDLQRVPPPKPDLHTGIQRPAHGSTLSGTTILDATTTDNVDVVKADFVLTGGGLSGTIVATGTRSLFGWVAHWNTVTVADGTYSLESVAYDSAGKIARSKPITVIVNNRAS
jgi:peptidoglycan/LPS O-acetylase OafA/YrhL